MSTPSRHHPVPGENRLGKLLIFDTHPIQYRSPVFRALAEQLSGFKVYFFNDSFDGSKWWYNEVGKIPRQSWEVDLKAGFPSQVLQTQKLGWKRTRRLLRTVLENEKPDAVAVYGYYMPEHWILRLLSRSMNIPLIFIGETFSQSPSPARRLLKKPLLNFFFSGVRQFIAIGDRTAGYYRTLGVPEAAITRARYCVDVSFFTKPPEVSEELRRKWRERLSLPQDAFVTLFVGRLFERKRPWDMFAVHARLRNRTNYFTVLAGNGPMENELREEARRESRLRLLGFQNQSEVSECYHGADLLVVPSEFETWGLVVNEAFAAGTPAIVTETCGAAGDLVVDGETGFIVPVGDVDRISAHVESLMSDPAAHREMARRAREKVEREYSVDQFAGAFLESLKQAVK